MVETGISSDLLRWIPALPLLGALVHGVGLGLLRRDMPRGLVVAISCGAPIAAFVVTCMAFAQMLGGTGESRVLVDEVFTWIGSGRVSAEMGFSFDSLTAIMCLIVTGVGSLIHVYSIGYMDDDHRDDGGFQRFFAYLNLFLCAMLLLVLGDNLLVLFLGWEGVGLCSYLLIGFWYGDRWNAYCGMKAFVVNRIGDFGFLIGIFLLLGSLGDAATLNFVELKAALPKIVEQTVSVPGWLPGPESWRLTTLIGLCFFLGACGKSAQIPLYTWLPDAMAGPTPVSALIHAATMVTAGVYMVCRMSFLYVEAPGASAVIAWIGAATALFAATMAIAQTDIKKVLAYSTVSQLGYMFLAAGCGAYGGGDLPRRHARLLQGAALPRFRRGDHGDAPRAGHRQDGRPAQVAAGDARGVPDRGARDRRLPAVLRLLLEGRDPALGVRRAPDPRPPVALGDRPRHRRDHRLLHVAAALPDLLWRVPRRCRDAAPHPRSGLGGARAARRAGGVLVRRRLPRAAADLRRLARRARLERARELPARRAAASGARDLARDRTRSRRTRDRRRDTRHAGGGVDVRVEPRRPGAHPRGARRRVAPGREQVLRRRDSTTR